MNANNSNDRFCSGCICINSLIIGGAFVIVSTEEFLRKGYSEPGDPSGYKPLGWTFLSLIGLIIFTSLFACWLNRRPAQRSENQEPLLNTAIQLPDQVVEIKVISESENQQPVIAAKDHSFNTRYETLLKNIQGLFATANSLQGLERTNPTIIADIQGLKKSIDAFYERYKDPILLKIMQNPTVLSISQKAFELSSIKEHILKQLELGNIPKCPLTNRNIIEKPEQLSVNTDMREDINNNLNTLKNTYNNIQTQLQSVLEKRDIIPAENQIPGATPFSSNFASQHSNLLFAKHNVANNNMHGDAEQIFPPRDLGVD